MERTIAVIGSAGRGEDSARMTRALYDAMVSEAAEAVKSWGVVVAVSGGAAFADHVAVRLFLDGVVKRLVLHLPADFDGRAFVPNPSVRFNPGQTCNSYHREFSRRCGLDSLSEIAEASRSGAVLAVTPGFHMRNSQVAADCTHLLAFTFGRSVSGVDRQEGRYRDFLPAEPGFTDPKAAGLRDGGTAHTWGQAWKPVIKRHVHLGLLGRE